MPRTPVQGPIANRGSSENPQGSGSLRFTLDEAPPQSEEPRFKQLVSMAGDRVTINSPSGEDGPDQDPGIGEMSANPAIRGIQRLSKIEQELQLLSVDVPGASAVVADFIAVLRQIIPKGIAAMQSGQPLGFPTGVPTQSALAGQPGMGGAPPAGVGVGGVPPGVMMGAGGMGG